MDHAQTNAVEPSKDTGLGPLAPVQSDVTLGGEVHTITPASLLNLARMAQALGPIMHALERLPAEASIGQALLPALMEPQHVEGLMTMTVIGSGLTDEQVAALPADEQLNLAIKVIEVNLDFFAQRLQPTLANGMFRLMSRILAGRI